jgi:hypothetical protein
MKNFKKKLNIEIEDLVPNEEEDQICQINTLLTSHPERFRKLNDSSGPMDCVAGCNGLDSYDSGKVISFLKELFTYMEEENRESDLSYKWYRFLK